jgi:hypothetical protein
LSWNDAPVASWLPCGRIEPSGSGGFAPVPPSVEPEELPDELPEELPDEAPEDVPDELAFPPPSVPLLLLLLVLPQPMIASVATAEAITEPTRILFIIIMMRIT